MGGSASYRLAKKIARAIQNGAPQSEIDELERQRQAAKEAERQKRLEAKQQPTEKSFRDKVNEAQTKEDLRAVLVERYGEENVAIGFTRDHDLEMTKRALNTLDELENRYPFMKGVISGFHYVVDPTVIFDPDGSIFASADTEFNPMTGESKHTLGLGAAFSTKDNPSLYTGTERGFNPPNMTPEAIIAHEFGHAMHNYLLGRILQDARRNGLFQAAMVADDIRKNKVLQRLEKEAKQALGYKKGLPNFRHEISGYASDAKQYGGNPTQEAFAEAFADVYANKDNASAVSKAYVNALLNEINRLGYGG